MRNLFWAALLWAGAAYGQQNLPCPEPAPGALVREPADLRSAGGTLSVDFSMRSGVDIYGLTRYCYVYNGSIQSPTLRVHPGDTIILRLRNELPAEIRAAASHSHMAAGKADSCGHGEVQASSTNLHFHGLNVPPVCHQDDVLHTLIQPGDAPFEYRMVIPDDQPPGLYWYHPHPHGFSEAQVLGGASGAMIVEGIERAAPTVAGLPERVLVLRDQLIGGVVEDASAGDEDRPYIPSRDLSLNYVPILYPLYKPSVILAQPQQKEFWRVLNASADTFCNLQVMFWPNRDTQVPQPMRVVAIDGVPVAGEFASSDRNSILISPGSRVEFIVTTPKEGVYAQLVAQRYDTGEFGNTEPYRVLANIRSFSDAPAVTSVMPGVAVQRTMPFAGLNRLTPSRQRVLYFSEKYEDPEHPKRKVSYFLTADNDTPKIFDMSSDKPDIVATQGTVEDWIVENRAREAHVFHIHQLHFQLLERDGKKVDESALRDTIELPYWDGKSATYPRVKLRMDFRGANTVGTFLYHCHILEHEDGGMMGSIRVKPAGK